MFSTVSALQLLIAALPFLLSLVSRTSKAIAPCLIASLFTVLLSGEPPRAAMAWCIGLLIAAVAVRERLRTI
jgi:ABC-type transport system involved in cytochrome bd biosynthesis fused ATPase/permease subunit